MNQERIGKLIKQIRKDHNLTQREFASYFNVTYQAVSKWENGTSLPDIVILKEICKKYDIDINDLLDGNKKIKKTKLKIIIGIIIFIILLILSIVLILKSSYEFKSISSNNNDFNVDGIAAYSYDKKSLYISNISYNKEDNTKYKVLKCTLYEKNNNRDNNISSCNSISDNNTIDNLLKSITFKINDYSKICKNNNLFIKVEATNSEDKVITYTIPIKLEDTCK